MAGFQKVMRQFDRMCKASVGCSNCPLHKPDSVSDECSIGAFVNNSERIEREIMSWAAEHPEPVYPTWFEVLENMGIAGRINGEPYYDSQDREVYLKQPAFTPKAFDPIPADIAEKLGIEPKEVR